MQNNNRKHKMSRNELNKPKYLKIVIQNLYRGNYKLNETSKNIGIR